MAPEHSLEVPEGPGSAPEVSGMSRNGPGMSRKVLEASRRFRKVPGSTTRYPTPLALGESHLGCPKSSKGRGGGNMGGMLVQGGLPSSLEEDSPVGRTPFGSRSPIGIPHLLGRPRQPLGHLYNEGEGQGAQLDETLAPWRLPSPLNPVCSTIRPRFRRCSNSESVRVFN